MTKRGVIIGVLVTLILGISIPLTLGVVDYLVNTPTEEYVPLDPEFLPKPTDGSKPSDHNVLDNYKIAGGVLSQTEYFKTSQEGNAVSEMIIKNNAIEWTTEKDNLKGITFHF